VVAGHADSGRAADDLSPGLLPEPGSAPEFSPGLSSREPLVLKAAASRLSALVLSLCLSAAEPHALSGPQLDVAAALLLDRAGVVLGVELLGPLLQRARLDSDHFKALRAALAA